MEQHKRNKRPQHPQKSLTFLPLGGIEDVTKNMYLYMVGDEILIVDCGLGFADETMLGVDLLIPDISYLQSQLQPKGQKKIVGMVLSHGHEDHIGALPFILPQLTKDGQQTAQFPIYASPLTAALTNEKLKEFRINTRVQTVPFTSGPISIGSFSVSFIRVTHSVPDSANLFIKTPAGNFYHGSDFKLDFTPADGKKSEYLKITKANTDGVLALMVDSLGAERRGFTPTELPLGDNFERAMRDVSGKVIITTYSSNIARLNQGITAAKRLGRKVCFVGRSVVKAVAVAKSLGYMKIPESMEVSIDQVKHVEDKNLVLFVAGSQGQENSSMSRIAGDEHREIKLTPSDLVIFSADTIPGNEILVRALMDDIAKKGTKVLNSDISADFHVSGHGSQGDLMLMMSLVGSEYVVPISAPYSSMVAFKDIAKNMAYKNNQILFPENGQEIIFAGKKIKKGKKHEIRNVYVDEISGEEVEGFVLRDRERLAKEGVIIVMLQLNNQSGKLVDTPDIIARGFSPKDIDLLTNPLSQEIRQHLGKGTNRVKNTMHMRKQLEDLIFRFVSRKLQRKPLVLPIIIEV